MLNRLSFFRKILFLLGGVSIAILLASGLSSYFFIKTYFVDSLDKEMNQRVGTAFNIVEGETESTIKIYLKTIAESNKELVSYYYDQVQNGKITETKAKEEIRRLTLFHKVGKSGYIYYLDSSGTLKVHPKKALVGVNISKHGFIQEQIREKEGYIEYMWKNPGEKEERAKVLYMTYFAPWDYIISVSAYKEELTMLVDIPLIRKKILSLNWQESDYAYLIDSKGNMIVHHSLEGTNQYKAQDSEGNYFMQQICDNKKGGTITYRFIDPSSRELREKIVYYKYIETMDWFICYGGYMDTIYAPVKKLLYTLATVSIIVLLLVIIVAVFFAKSLSKPIKLLGSFAETIGGGDLSIKIPVMSNDEIGYFSEKFSAMLSNLRTFIGQVQSSGIQIASSTTQLSTTATEQEATMKTQMESTHNVVKSVERISKISAQLSQTMHDVAAMLQKTVAQATASQDGLSDMGDAMIQMEEASKAISGRLEAINEKAENITNVVTTITKVSDQTNLLSLNAAIEAEKAGEYGRGFTVVAREIRRLADQTAVATLDIDQMVKEMQSAVSSGVMEMDKFSAQVSHNTDDIAQISQQLSGIIHQVQTLAPRFEGVNKSVEQQSENAQKISGAIEHLGEEMQELSQGIEEAFSAIRQLNDAGRELRDQVSQFKVE